MIQNQFRGLLVLLISYVGVSGSLTAQQSGDSKKSDLSSKKKETRVGKKSKPDYQNTIAIFDGKSLKGIRVLKKSYFEDHGKVNVKNGVLILPKGMPGTGISVDPKIHKDLPRMNYEVTIQAKRIEGGDFFCGLTFPVNKSYCTLILGGWGGGSIGLSNIDSLSAIENETTGFHEFKNNQWYDIHLDVSEKSIRATLKETGAKATAKELFKIDPSEHKFDIWWEQEPARPFGITTWNTTGAFKRLEIRRLKPEKKTKK